MTATIGAGTITIAGADNTLESIYNDLNGAGKGAKVFTQRIESGKPIYYFMDSGATTYTMTITNNATLTMCSSNSVTGTEFRMSSVADDNMRLSVAAGGTLNMYGPIKFDAAYGHSNANRPYVTFVAGAINVSGCKNSGASQWPHITHLRGIYFQELQENDTYVNDLWRFRNCIFSHGVEASMYAYYFYQIGKWRKGHTWDNIWFSGSSSPAASSWTAFTNSYDIISYEDFVVSNCKFEHLKVAPFNFTKSIGWIKNCTFYNMDGDIYVITVTGPRSEDTTYRFRSYGYATPPELSQNLGTYVDSCIFCNSGTNQSCLTAQAGGAILVKGCTFKNTVDATSAVTYSGIVRFWSGNTFSNNYCNHTNSYNASTNFVNLLKLRVVDTFGNPISGAIAYIRQKDGKEVVTLKTMQNGYLRNSYFISGAILTWKHLYGAATLASPGTAWEIWSSGSTGYHTAIVYKEGYRPYTKNYVMAPTTVEDTVVLDRMDSYSLTF